MFQNCFISGTSTELIHNISNNTDFIGEHCFGMPVLLPDEQYGKGRQGQTPTLTAYSAPLMYATAQTQLSHISIVFLCIRIPPSIPTLYTHNQQNAKAFEHSFHIEWFFQHGYA